ncbi:MAG: lipopolysaccharide assembly protein LapB [Burkholderiales bacterium]|nr:lipopolysaccharide assembly protein LapB [Burkholderiales bacterium]
MDFDLQWLLVGLPVAFALGWLASRFDLRQQRRDSRDAPRAYFKGLNLLLNEQQDKAIDAFIEAVQNDPETSELHFALGNLFRRRGEFERAVRVHQHLLSRADLKAGERDRAQHELAQDYVKAGLFDRAEEAYRALDGTAFAAESRLALLSLYERSRDWAQAAEIAQRLEAAGAASFAARIGHYECELALQADQHGDGAAADAALARARKAAPEAPRPLVLAGERAARAGRHEQALAAWDELRQRRPDDFVLVAGAYAESAIACSRQESARRELGRLFAERPSLDLLRALERLGSAPPLLPFLQAHPTLSAAQQWLAQPRAAWSEEGVAAAREALARAAAPLQRFRCAACGFESRQYFWQCPGCLSWDSFPPERIEEL